MDVNNHVLTMITSLPGIKSRFSLGTKLRRTQAKPESKGEDRISDPLFSLISIFS